MKRNYKVETLLTACELFDLSFKKLHTQIRNLTYEIPTILITCVLMAAKLEQPLQPSLAKMLTFLSPKEQAYIKVSDVIKMEEKIIFLLDFEL